MKILGLNSGEFNSSASILRNGEITSAVQEERLNRFKFTKAFPSKSIKFCLDNEKLKISELDAISVGWNPSAHMIKFNPQFSEIRTLREKNFYTISDNLFNLTKRDSGDYTLIKHGNNKNIPKIYHVQHHLCHASNAFFLSNFEEAAILTVDFKGENQCTTWSYGKNNKIKADVTTENLIGAGMIAGAGMLMDAMFKFFGAFALVVLALILYRIEKSLRK